MTVQLLNTRHWHVSANGWRSDKPAPRLFLGMCPSRNGVEVGAFGRHLLIAHLPSKN